MSDYEQLKEQLRDCIEAGDVPAHLSILTPALEAIEALERELAKTQSEYMQFAEDAADHVIWRTRYEATAKELAEARAREERNDAFARKMAELASAAAKKLVYFADYLDHYTDGQEARRTLANLEKEAREALTAPAPEPTTDEKVKAMAALGLTVAKEEVEAYVPMPAARPLEPTPTTEAERRVLDAVMKCHELSNYKNVGEYACWLSAAAERDEAIKALAAHQQGERDAE